MKSNIEKEFIDFYEKETDAVFRFFLVRLPERETALDLTQETFLKYWKTMQKEKVENARAYIFSVARNALIDWYRKKKSISLEEFTEGEDGQHFDLPDESSPNPEKTASARMALEKINELPPNQREIIYMRFVEDLPPQEIAKILQESANVVSVRLSRALEALRKILRINEMKKN